MGGGDATIPLTLTEGFLVENPRYHSAEKQSKTLLRILLTFLLQSVLECPLYLAYLHSHISVVFNV